MIATHARLLLTTLHSARWVGKARSLGVPARPLYTRTSVLASHATSQGQGTEELSSEAGSAAAAQSNPAGSGGVYALWRSQWASFLASLHRTGHYAADPQVQHGLGGARPCATACK